MSKNRFVKVEPPERYTLQDSDDWIEFKRRLTYGETKRLENASVTGVHAKVGVTVQNGEDTEVSIDMAKLELERIMTWTTDWSFTDDNDKSVALTRAAVQNLDISTAEEIIALLDKHEEEMTKLKN